MRYENCSVETDQQGRELREHGDAFFPFACYRDDITRYPVIGHWHDELEAGIVTKGKARISVGAQILRLSAGDGFFINAGMLHNALPASAEEDELHSVVFHPRLIGGSPESVFWQKYLLPMTESHNPPLVVFSADQETDRRAIRDIADAWEAGYRETAGYEFAVREALSHLIFDISQRMPEHPVPVSEKMLRDSARMKQMLQFIREHYAEEITIEQIARSASVSKSECLRCFKGIVRTTPVQYLRQYRIRRAAELLSSAGLSVSKIGERCGFREMSYFARTFREETGATPTEYRKERLGAV